MALEGSVEKNSAITMKYSLARRVHGIVGTTDDRPGRIEILLDSKPLDANTLGKDSRQHEGSSVADINWLFMHNLVKTERAESHEVSIRPLTENIAFYTFVFG